MIRTAHAVTALTLLVTAPVVHAAETHLEIAVYTVHDSSTFPAVRADAVRRMSGTPGFRTWVRLVADDGLQADVLLWETLEDAKRAAASLPEDPAFAPFIGSIKEMRHFGHLSAPAMPETIIAALDAGPLVEIALYTIKDPTIFEPARDMLYSRLATRQNGPSGSFLVADGVASGRGDLLVWPDRETWEQTGQEMMAQPDLGPFFTGIDKMAVFSLFRKDPAS